MAAGHRRVIPLGHSEGGLVALAAMPRLPAPAGLILVCAPGRPLAQIIRGQPRANPANAALLDQAEAPSRRWSAACASMPSRWTRPCEGCSRRRCRAI
ncbi:alpha/beta fold hydrolase [Paracoccus sp. ME4]|uniref:alpha/beta fold hydrolase n=1 Tax=Paracoccus sp. ME4 TaxID=3138066 RepID=UPI00398AB9A5